MKTKFLLFSLGLVSLLFIILFFSLSSIITDDTELNNDNISQNSSNQEQQAGNTPSEKNKKNSISKENKRFVQDSDAISKETNSSINSNLNKANHEEALSKTTDKSPEQPKETLDEGKSAIPMNFTLFNGIDNKALINYPVELRCQFGKEPERVEKFVTDENGKITFLAPKNSGAFFTFITADYIPLREYYKTHYGENSYNIKLFKGGTLEIKVKTTDQKKVDKLTALLEVITYQRNTSEIEMIFDPARDLFYSSVLPVGTLELSFKSPNYEETTLYRVPIHSKEATQIEIQLTPVRRILFQLNPESPTTHSIFVVPVRPEARSLNYRSGTKVLQDERKQYPYEVPTQQIERVMVYVTDYLPQSIILEPNKDLYLVPLAEAHQAKIFVTDENNVPLSNATISYFYTLDNTSERYNLRIHLDELSVMDASLTLTTNQEGVAILNGLAKKTRIAFFVSHPNYKETYSYLDFDTASNNTLHIKMSTSCSLSGKITFQSQPIPNAIVFVESWKRKSALAESDWVRMVAIAETKSAKDGSYTLNYLDQEALKGGFTVKAFHTDYGVAEIPLPSFNKEQGPIDLELKEKTVGTLRLIDEDNKALPFKNISINNAYRSEVDFSMSVLTDKDGNYELKNIPQFRYIATFNDKFYYIENNSIILNNNKQHTLVAKRKGVFPIHVSRTDGREFKGLLKVWRTNTSDSWPLEVLFDERGNRYLDEADIVFYYPNSLLFEAEGFAPITKGPFHSEEDTPKEIILEFDTSDSFEVTVWDNEIGRFFSGIIVEVLLNGVRIQALPTNEKGHIVFSHLPKEFHLRIKHPDYIAYESSFNTENQKEAEIQLIHGGTLKGHYALKEGIRDAHAVLAPGSTKQFLDKKGNFEFRNLQPGEYTLSIRYTSPNYLVEGEYTLSDLYTDPNYAFETKEFPTKIIIKNMKTVEIDLDKVQKEE